MSRLEVLLRLSLLHAELKQIANGDADEDLRQLAAYVARLLRARAHAR